ncbi:nuclear pore complex protein Nup98-Nup96, partial [Asbolus verrucosus]
MYPNYINKPSFMTNTPNTSFGASTSSFGQPAANTPMFPSMQPSNIFQTPSTSSFNAGPSSQTSFVQGRPWSLGPGFMNFARNVQTDSNERGAKIIIGDKPPSLDHSLLKYTGGESADYHITILLNCLMLRNSVPSHKYSCLRPHVQRWSKDQIYLDNNNSHLQVGYLAAQIHSARIKLHLDLVLHKPKQAYLDNKHSRKLDRRFSSRTQRIYSAVAMLSEAKDNQELSSNFRPLLVQTLCRKMEFLNLLALNIIAHNSKQVSQLHRLVRQQEAQQLLCLDKLKTNKLLDRHQVLGKIPLLVKPHQDSELQAKPTLQVYLENLQHLERRPVTRLLLVSTQPHQLPIHSAQVKLQNHFRNRYSGLTPHSLKLVLVLGTLPATCFKNLLSPLQDSTLDNQVFLLTKREQLKRLICFKFLNPVLVLAFLDRPTLEILVLDKQVSQLLVRILGNLQQPLLHNQHNLRLALIWVPLFGNTASKPTSLFGTTTTGGSLFNNNVFQQTPTSFSLNMNQQQQIQFPPEPSDDSKNISLIATDSFPDGPHVYGLEPVLGESNNSTTNPQDIKAMLDYSKKRDELLGTRSKIKVHLPKPKRGTNFSKEFFETNQALKSSHKCLVIRKFNDNSSTIYNKYNNELLDEAEECLKTDIASEADSSSIISPRSFMSDSDVYLDKPIDNQMRNFGLRLFDSKYSEETSDEAKSNKSNFTFDESATFLPLGASSKTSLNDTKIIKTGAFTNNVTLAEEETTITESDMDLPSNVSVSEVENSENPAGIILTKPEYYMYPALKDLHQYMDENGECVVQGLTIGRRGYGNVYFPDSIDIANMNLDEIVHFRHRELIIYPDDTKKPPVSEGLNRRAQVTLDKIYPREKGTNKYITDPNEIAQTNFVDNLIHVTQKHKCKFVDYRPKTGSWVFKVKHFSKYAFTDSDEEECEVTGDKVAQRKLETKKVEEIEDLPRIGLGGKEQVSQVKILTESDSFVTDPTLIDYWPEDERYMLTEDMYRTDSAIQTLKSSLFTNLETITTTKKVESQVIKPKQEIRSEVISVPKVHKLPDVTPALIPQKISGAQRCYTDLGIFRNKTFKVGWAKGFNFYNIELIPEGELVYAYAHCNIQVESKGYYKAMMPNLTDMLQITLDESEFSFDKNNIPTLHIKKELSYLQKQTDLFNDHVRTKTLTVYGISVLRFGAKEIIRRVVEDSILVIVVILLKKFAYDLSDEWNMAGQIDVKESEAFKTIFKLLSFHKITEACEFATKSNLSQLSLMISQLSANERYKHWMRKYIEGFAWKEKNIVTDEFKKLYLLLSGIPVDASINVCEDLDWMRCFGFHLWYVAPAAAPIDVAFKLYKRAFEESEYATTPTPPYSESKAKTKNYDLLYHILAVYSDKTYQLCHLLHPETHTEKLMDYRLSWFLLQLFLSLKVGLIRKSEQEHLHTIFSTQLENMGLWKWSIFTLLFLDDNIVKKNLIMRILDKNLSTFTETAQTEKELVNIFKIPSSWIHEIKAIKAKASGYCYEYFQHFVYLEDWHQANSVLVEFILPELFMNEQYEHLINFISKIEPFSKNLVNWNTQEGLFKDFVELRDMLCNSSEDKLQIIVSKLNSLFRRINSFPVKNDMQKLCVAELSRKCALLFKLLYKSLDNQTVQTKFVDLLNNLIMPSDIKHYEIFHLMCKYIKPEEIVQ